MSKFQVILLGVFGVIIVISVILFSKYQGNGANAVPITIWGTVSNNDFQTIITKTSLNNSKLYTVTYAQKSPGIIFSDFVESLAAGAGPDLIMLPQDKITQEKNKLTIIPYSAYSVRSFKDAFIEAGEIYLLPEGIAALPLTIDPLVMYWNRSVFTDSGLTEPPQYWDEFYNLTQSISKKDQSLNILRSAVSLGEYSNVSNAKAILSTLMMQAGTPIVDDTGSTPVSVMADSFNKPLVPAEAAVNFYTQFSNPAKPFYSWNRSLPESSTYFLSNNLGIYFGFASELFDIQKKNPNLNFDVAQVPSSRDDGSGDVVNTSFANLTGLAISRGTKNPTAALQVATILTGTDGDSAFSQVLSLPPVRRDLLGAKQTLNPYQQVFYSSAIRAHAWLDPNPDETNKIFQELIESITSGRDRTSSAVGKASRAIADLFK